MKLEQLTLKGVGPLNEDAYIINARAQLFGVVDGVSSLVPYTNERNETGGFIASQLTKRYLEEIGDSTDLSRHVGLANERLAERMKSAGIDTRKKETLWGAALALVAIEEDAIRYIQTGDCMIFAV